MPPPKDPIKYEEMRHRQSEAAKKRCEDPKYIEHLSDIRRGKPSPMKDKQHSEESRGKMSKSHLGKEPWNKGKHPSEETRKKLCEKRRLRVISQETKDKMSKSMQGKKMPPCSDELRKKRSDIAKDLMKNPEYIKKLSKARKGKYCGEKHPNWQGGLSFGKYCKLFNDRFKERQRAYMGYLCMLCGTPQNGVKHIPHHVNYDKMMCCNDIKPTFVTLCRSCHSKTNFNREWWEQYFTEIIETYYQGKTFFTEEEMIAWESG